MTVPLANHADAVSQACTGDDEPRNRPASRSPASTNRLIYLI